MNMSTLDWCVLKIALCRYCFHNFSPINCEAKTDAKVSLEEMKKIAEREEGMNRVHLYLRRDPFRPRNFKGTIKPVALVIKNQSSPQLYDNILSR